MDNSSHFRIRTEDRIEGTCNEMCPTKERHMREKEGLLHQLEISISLENRVADLGINETKRGQSNRGFGRRTLPKADIQKTIKSFARSAAGLDKTVLSDLRPPHVLMKTVDYLCTKILVITNEPFHVIYDFMFDRLRSIRQDLVIQRIIDRYAIKILETTVRFHLYCAYRLRYESVSNFEAHINKKHFIDCLNRLLTLYDVNNYWELSRIDFECLYCLSAPDSFDVISRAFSIRRKLNSRLFDTTIKVCLAYQSKNYVQFFRLIHEFPPLIATNFVQHVKYMRRSAFQIMSVAYGVKTCKVPMSEVVSTLSYCDCSHAEKDLRHFSVEICTDDQKQKYIRFSKVNKIAYQQETDALNYDLNGPNRYITEVENMHKISKLICPWSSS